jgi:putative DNA primase/helicase
VTAAEIASALGGAHPSGAWWRCRCPIHASRGPSLALRDGDRGLVVHCHAGCSRAQILAELGRRGLIEDCVEARSIPDPEAGAGRREAEAADRQRGIAEALDIWNESHPAEATPQLPRYLASRGYCGPIPPTIRLHGMHGSYGRHPSGERRPQMVGLVEHVDYGPVGVSRTFLAIDGSQKATLDPVRLFRGPVTGGAVRLGTIFPDDWLIVAEGLETTLSVIQATGLPGWAALSAGGIARLILPPEARRVLIAADNDANGVGAMAAHDAARRWLGEGRRAKIVVPPEVGCDFNDVLAGRVYGRIAETSVVAA